MARKIDPLRAELFDQKQRDLFCDVTLVATADGTAIRAHRNVLHAASDYFKVLLTADLKEKSLDEISLNEVSGVVLRQLVDYAYTRHIDIDASNVGDILAAADFFLLDDVVKMCEQSYLQSMDATNVLLIPAIAEKYRLGDLEQRARNFAHDRFLDIVRGETFLALEATAVLAYLGSDDIRLGSEEDVFNAIAKWIEADVEDRKQHYIALMKTVRMSRIDSKFLSGRIQEWSKEMEMLHVYDDACAEKHRQDVEVTDAERKYNFKYMYVAGKLDTRELQIDRYSFATNEWEDVRTLPEFGCANVHCIDNSIYLFQIGSDINKVLRISLATMELETRKPMKNGSYDYETVAVGQHVYCIGGLPEPHDYKGLSARYDTKNDEWIDIAMPNEGRFCAGTAALAGKIYVVAGQDEYGGELSSVERYDPETNLWTNVAELNIARDKPRCCIMNGSIYVVGGDYEGVFNSYEKYDEQLDKWTIIEQVIDWPRFCFGMAAFGDWIYMTGGLDENFEASNEVQRINLRNGQIEQLPPMRHQMGYCDMTT